MSKISGRNFSLPVYLYLSLILLFLMNRWIEYNQIHIPLLYAYLDDLLLFPVLLPVIAWVHRRFSGSDRMMIPFSHVVLAVGSYSLFFEIIAPRFLSVGEGDPLDVVAYSLGASVTVLAARCFYGR